MQAEPPVQISALFEQLRRASRADPAPTLAQRQERLQRLLALIDHHEAAFTKAISQDFSHRSAHETRMAETLVVRSAIRHAQSHLKRWMHERRMPTALHFLPGYNRLQSQPLGVVGIVSPWNYPLQLALAPAVAALAAGNRLMLKPSELTPAFSEHLALAVSEHFAPDEVVVVTGDATVARQVVQLPFDHLFFTGSTAVGRQVALAAAANLTPVTLELGGKSPAILDTSVRLVEAAPRLAYGKLLNAGQTCVAPDHLLVPRGQSESVASSLRAAMASLYPTLRDNPDYTAIISPAHLARLQALLDDALAKGARAVVVNPAQENLGPTRKMAPTLLLGVKPDMRVMQEEIFGPLLPIVEYDRPDDAIALVNQGERPLALYWFGENPAARDRVLARTVSGGVTINDCLWHLGQEDQPFGGVGASGQGAYHGEWGFRTFSHQKPVFHQSRWAGTAWLRPPYGQRFEQLMAVLKRIT